MPVTFENIQIGQTYSRRQLAELWGYAGVEALQRGVVTPRDDNKIILFVTEDKLPSATQYKDRLVGSNLEWEGPNDHFAEQRIVDATRTNDEIHFFYRQTSRESFSYYGQIQFLEAQRYLDKPSRFSFKLPHII